MVLWLPISIVPLVFATLSEIKSGLVRYEQTSSSPSVLAKWFSQQSRDNIEISYTADLFHVFLTTWQTESLTTKVLSRIIFCYQSKSRRDQCYRFDIEVEKFKPADDITSLRHLRNQVQSLFTGRELRRQVVRNLLLSSFYFELDNMPVFEDGVHLCTGYIRIRNDPEAVLSTLYELFPSSGVEFRVSEPKNERRYAKGE